MKDLMNNVHPLRGISPAAATTDDTAWVSQINDSQGQESVAFLLLIGALADANATFAVLFEHGDDSGLSDAAAAPDSDLIGTEALAAFTFDDDDETRKIGYRGNKRYQRVTVTPSGNTGNAFCAGCWLNGSPRSAPSANPPV